MMICSSVVETGVFVRDDPKLLIWAKVVDPGRSPLHYLKRVSDSFLSDAFRVFCVNTHLPWD